MIWNVIAMASAIGIAVGLIVWRSRLAYLGEYMTMSPERRWLLIREGRGQE